MFQLIVLDSYCLNDWHFVVMTRRMTQIIKKDIVHSCLDATINVIMEDLGKEFFCNFVLRFVNKKGEVVERFVGLRYLSDTSALTLKAIIYDMISKRNFK
uniref:DUF4371 domain-containing protein n=1 Tax=Lactuca sativa TaxID=4236 RepID=A0A9R1UT02_LACSA|nr:hypothetical protein LSAT_V11C800435120 [Lactuca sativa]